ncbi:hypothetical protein [Flavisphingomonas formosensis]|uniref:hypothetical protein n=1 Tax=Flavisphingomonas formosensis TaxID=861534 RepID=UPI0012F75E7C|nr:hypothetical protein [Sphingomonas formosensis]
MKVAAVAGFIALAACGKSDQTPGENVADQYSNVADSYDAAASNTTNDNASDALSNTADAIRSQGENAGDAIDNGSVPAPANSM